MAKTPILQSPISTSSLDYLAASYEDSTNSSDSSVSGRFSPFRRRNVSLSPISGRFPYRVTSPAIIYRKPICPDTSRGSKLASNTQTLINALVVCPDEVVDQKVEAIKTALNHFSKEIPLLLKSIKSLCASARPTLKRAGYQLVKEICDNHSAHLSAIEWRFLWTTLSHSKLEQESSTLESQLEALSMFVERREPSYLLVIAFNGLLSWLPDGTDIGNLDVGSLQKCDGILITIISKNASFLNDLHFNELLGRYCSSVCCALQDDRFHKHADGPSHHSSPTSPHTPPHHDAQPTLTLEERATRLMDFLRHIHSHGFIPETSFPILVRTICRVSYHLNVCMSQPLPATATHREIPIHIRALNHRCVRTVKRILEDRHFGWPAFEAVVLPGNHYDWRFACGAIFIVRGLISEALSDTPRSFIQFDAMYQPPQETTVQFEDWMRMLGRIPGVWLGKLRGDRVLVELSYLAEEIVAYCKYHQSSEMATFVGQIISGLADALKRYRCQLGLKRRFTLGTQNPHSNPLVARAEWLLSMDMATTMRPPLVITLMTMTEHLCDESMVKVITHLRKSGRLEPTFPYWKENLKRLLEFFATKSQDYPKSREVIATYLAEFYDSDADIEMRHDEIYEDILDVLERTLPSETSEIILTAACRILCKEIIMSYGMNTPVSDRIRILWRGIALQSDYLLCRTLVAVKFLIVAFNNFAFPAARKLDMLCLNADRGPAASMAITLFQDLLYLAGMNQSTDDSNKGPNMTCQSARLIILQWLLRLRSGARHRIFTVDGMLSEVYPLAKLAYRVGEEAETMSWSLKASLDARYFRGTSHSSPSISTFESFRNERSKHWLPVSLYVNTLCDILDYDCDWGPVSLILCHLPLQLSNKHFFCGPKVSPTIRRLSRSICSAIYQDKLYKQMSGITPSQPGPDDVKAVLYQSLTVLISYRWRLQPNDKDEGGRGILMEVIETFVDGLGTSVVTSKPCLEALSLCVFSLPMLDRFSSTIIERLSRTMTNPDLALHILEFLVVIGFRPRSKYNNSLRSEDYRRVFQVALMYIDHHYRPDVPVLRTSNGHELFSLTEHVLNMAFYVMHIWFINLKPTERIECIPLITDQLVASNGRGPLRPPTAVFLDWLARYAHGNVDPKVPTSPLYRSVVCPQVSKGWDRNILQKWNTNFENEKQNIAKFGAWKLGASIITISCLKNPVGWIRIVNRRPSCMVELVCHLEGEHRSLHSILDVEKGTLERLLGDISETEVSNKDIFQADPVSGLVIGSNSYSDPPNPVVDPALLAPLLMTQPSHPSRRLRRFKDPDQPQFRTLLELIDKTPVIDTHKVGVLYVAPGQSTEREILSNRHGSPAYSKFIKKLGRVIKPSHNLEVYTGGLNVNQHGTHALAWWDDISQVLFHVATFMPAAGREGIEYKKTEIGNDAVKIVWNEGKPYQWDTMHSAFNLINIIIEPHTLMPKACYQENHHINGSFKVTLQTNPSLPAVTPIGDSKIVAAEHLPELMRRYATIACMFCYSWETTGMDTCDRYPLRTNWQARLDLINRAERLLGDEQEDEEIMHGYCTINPSHE